MLHRRRALGLTLICGSLALWACSDDSAPPVDSAVVDAAVDASAAEGGVDAAPVDGSPGEQQSPDAGQHDLGIDTAPLADTGVTPDTACSDDDGDGVCNASDECPGEDDRVDLDGDSVPDCKQSRVNNGQFYNLLGTMEWSGTATHLPTVDALQNPKSGALEVKNTTSASSASTALASNCNNGEAGGIFQGTLQYFIPAGQGVSGSAGARLAAYDNSGCSGTPLAYGTLDVSFSGAPGSWHIGTVGPLTAPLGAKYIAISVKATKPGSSGDFAVRYDNVMVTKDGCRDVDQDNVCDNIDHCNGKLDRNGSSVADCDESVLANGQFTVDVSSWQAQGNNSISWKDDPADGDPFNGVAVVTNTNPSTTVSTVTGSVQCINAAAGANVKAYVEYFIPSGQGSSPVPGVQIRAFSAANCSGTINPNGLSNSMGWSTTLDTWHNATHSFTTPTGTQSIWLRLNVSKSAGDPDATVHYDNVILTL